MKRAVTEGRRWSCCSLDKHRVRGWKRARGADVFVCSVKGMGREEVLG
jgi:hypothetical protein